MSISAGVLLLSKYIRRVNIVDGIFYHYLLCNVCGWGYTIFVVHNRYIEKIKIRVYNIVFYTFDVIREIKIPTNNIMLSDFPDTI